MRECVLDVISVPVSASIISSYLALLHPLRFIAYLIVTITRRLYELAVVVVNLPQFWLAGCAPFLNIFKMVRLKD
jgi:hypothetical protein